MFTLLCILDFSRSRRPSFYFMTTHRPETSVRVLWVLNIHKTHNTNDEDRDTTSLPYVLSSLCSGLLFAFYGNCARVWGKKHNPGDVTHYHYLYHLSRMCQHSSAAVAVCCYTEPHKHKYSHSRSSTAPQSIWWYPPPTPTHETYDLKSYCTTESRLGNIHPQNNSALKHLSNQK
jgi:hypothetical protein